MALEARIREQIKKQRHLPQKERPPLTVIAFEPGPTYLPGKSDQRDTPKQPWLTRFLADANPNLDDEQIAILRNQQDTYTWRGEASIDDGGVGGNRRALQKYTCIPDIETSSRPMSTYFGPGQLVLWPVIDVRNPEFRGLNASNIESWLSQLTCSSLRLIEGFRSRRAIVYKPNSGIWVASEAFKGSRQIADIRVRLQDDIATFGLTLNFDVPVHGSSNVNPWARMEEAGLSFNPATSVTCERGFRLTELGRDKEVTMKRMMDHLARRLFETMGIRMGWTADPDKILGDDWKSLFTSERDDDIF